MSGGLLLGVGGTSGPLLTSSDQERTTLLNCFFRFESLEPEMNNQASRVAVVNQIARQLMHSGHPSEKEIKAQQDKLNTR